MAIESVCKTENITEEDRFLRQGALPEGITEIKLLLKQGVNSSVGPEQAMGDVSQGAVGLEQVMGNVSQGAVSLEQAVGNVSQGAVGLEQAVGNVSQGAVGLEQAVGDEAAHADRKEEPIHDRAAHYEEEWSPAHGYRGEGFWSVTRRAVESACVNEGLELTDEELNTGANTWFYSGVTLLFYNEPYGSGWSAFLS